MNEDEYLIYNYSAKNQKWYEATKNIVWFRGDDNAWSVKFKNSDEFYHISYSKMQVFDRVENVNYAEVFYKELPCFNIKKLLLFNRQIYKIFYNNGYTCLASPNEIRIVKNVLKDDKKSNNVMSYYKRVVAETAKTQEDEFMISQFDDIDYVNSESVLSLYLRGGLAKSEDRLDMPIICPFGLNMSQSKALEMALKNRISIIEGPPGTGKTQTILNIISNAVIRGKSVAVVSNNNSATNNIFIKLKKYGYSFICAPLGNADNVDKFFKEYDSSNPKIEKQKVDVYKLNNLYLGLPKYFEKENLKKNNINILNAVELEYKHFLEDNSDIDFNKYNFIKINNISPNTVQKVIVRLKEKNKMGFFDKLFIRRKLGIKSKFLKPNSNLRIVLLQNLYYLSKIKCIQREINKIDKYMQGQSFNEKVDLYKSLSNSYFSNKLAEHYDAKVKNKYNRDDYKRNFSDFVKDYPVILSSTYALAKCTQKGYLFDYLIVDESSQVNMASAILSMRVAKNVIVVGDIRQLPQIDDSTFYERNEELLKQFNIPKAYSYQGNSIMSSLLTLYGDSVPKQMLKEHYRCAPEIIEFCNKEFYNNELVIYTESKKNINSMQIIKTIAGNFARKNSTGSGLYNQREIDEIGSLLSKEKYEDIGVITPYRYQAELIQEKFGDKLEASTIHKFQGREKKTIIFSSVINDVNDFVGNDNLINVAVSRAVENFILITSDKVANSKTGVLSDLINYISYNNDFGKISKGEIKSIYDILYSDYEDELNKFRKNHPSKDFDTENLTKELLKKILSDCKYKSLWFRMHVSLRDFIINNNHNLTDEEFKFYINPNSHVDFLIYNKMSKKPVFAIEVDGVFFHEQNKTQRARDVIKDEILRKSNLTLLRLKTNESSERDRIVSCLDSVLGH